MRDKFCLKCIYHKTCDRCGDKIISEFIDDLKWIQEDFYNEDEENRNTIIQKKWEGKLK